MYMFSPPGDTSANSRMGLLLEMRGVATRSPCAFTASPSAACHAAPAAAYVCRTSGSAPRGSTAPQGDRPPSSVASV